MKNLYFGGNLNTEIENVYKIRLEYQQFMNASIHDVAKRAGVSIATVSRVVNNSAGVKESKVAAVKEALEYYDYQPSQFGRGLVTGTSKMIGVYSPLAGGSMFESGYMLECLRGIDNIIRESSYSLLLMNEPVSYEKSEKAKPKFIEYVNQKKIDGLIVLTIPSDGRLEGALSAIIEDDFPVGYIGKRFGEKGMNVYASYEEYMMDGIRRLYEKGHREIAFLPMKSRSATNQKIKSKAEIKYSGLKVNITDTTSDIDIEFLRDILEYMMEEELVTAMIVEDLRLLAKVQSILSTMGKQIGNDISVICVEHVKNEGAKMLPKIDCYYVPALQLGETIATELLDNLTGKKTKEISKRFMPEYIERGSVKEIE